MPAPSETTGRRSVGYAALEIGRIMRERKTKAAVGRTIPQGCDSGE
ncbi:MAG: hypothetical protein WCE79_19745 [Xanthobacteraceae bacterium]